MNHHQPRITPGQANITASRARQPSEANSQRKKGAFCQQNAVQVAQEVLAKKLGDSSLSTKVSESDIFYRCAQLFDRPTIHAEDGCDQGCGGACHSQEGQSNGERARSHQ
jgi:hypothetical protein